VATMLLSGRAPIRTAASTCSSSRWMLRSTSESRTSICGCVARNSAISGVTCNRPNTSGAV